MKIKKVMALTMASAMVISMALSGCGSDGGSRQKKAVPKGKAPRAELRKLPSGH